MISGAPRSGKSALLVEHLHRLQEDGLRGDRTLVLAPDRRSARRLSQEIGPPLVENTGRIWAVSYHSFLQDVIRRWWPLVMADLGVRAATPEFLPFNLAQFACLEEYHSDPGHLQRLTIREQRLIVQLLSTMNLSAANGLTLEAGWSRVAMGLGVRLEDPVIQDALRLTESFRERCLEAGILPFDLQVEAAGTVLANERARFDIVNRYDLLAVDDLDEFVPLLADRLTGLAAVFPASIVTLGEDGGLRWFLGASVEHSRALCDHLVAEHGFERERLDVTPPRPVDWIVEGISGDPVDPPANLAGWHLHEAVRPDEMCGRVVDEVTRMVADGARPGEIVLLIPYLDTLTSSELARGFAAAQIEFHVERRWQSLLDDRESRACLTALRSVNLQMGRRATLLEVADLLAVLTGENPVTVQPWARSVFIEAPGAFREPKESEQVPREVRLLGRWGERVVDRGDLHWQLESLAQRVLAPHQSGSRTTLVSACYRLANEARRFAETTPRLKLAGPVQQQFFDYVDSDVVAADSGQFVEPRGVVLTTPSAFLISSRPARYQCWLDIASPAWWEPPLLLLANPHAMSGPAEQVARNVLDEDRVRASVLGRTLRNLSARCDDGVHAFATHINFDGEPLDGPLSDAFLAMRAMPV